MLLTVYTVLLCHQHINDKHITWNLYKHINHTNAEYTYIYQ